MAALNSIQKNGLTKVFNLGMGCAANSMSEIVGTGIKITVPYLELLSRQEAVSQLAHLFNGQLSGVSQDFFGPLNGSVVMLIPKDKSLEFVRLFVRDSIPLDTLTEFEEEALSEVGNITMNACLSKLADLFEEELSSSLPIYMVGASKDILVKKSLQSMSELNQDVVLLLHIDFYVGSYVFDAYIVFVMHVISVKELHKLLDNLLERKGS